MEETPASTTITTLVSTTLEDDEKIHFTQAATIFAAVCASIFTVIGIGGEFEKKRLVFKKFIEFFRVLFPRG